MVKHKMEESDNSETPQEEEHESKENTDDSETPKEETKEPEDDNSALKEKVTGYIKTDDLIRVKKEEIKELMEKKGKYEEFIKNYLEKANKTKIETNDGEIVFKKQSSKAPLKEELVEKAIVKKFQDTKKINESGIKIAHDILEELNNMRGVSVKNNIKRIKKRDTRKK